MKSVNLFILCLLFLRKIFTTSSISCTNAGLILFHELYDISFVAQETSYPQRSETFSAKHEF